MTTCAPFPSRSVLLIQVGIGLTALCLAGQVHAQVVEPTPNPEKPASVAGGKDNASTTNADKVDADKGAARGMPSRREAVSRGPVQPRHYPSSPLPPVPPPPSKR